MNMFFTEVLLPVIFVIAAFGVIYFTRMFAVTGISKHWIAVAFAVKLISAAVMIFIYSGSDRHKADIFRFYDDSQIIYNVLKTEPVNYLKMVSGIGGEDPYLYKYYNRTDNWPFSDNSRLNSNNRLFIRYLAFVSIPAFGSYYAVLVITLFFAFTGLFWFFRFFNSFMPEKKYWIFALVFFTPSVAFWTSGLLKESLIIAFTGLMLNCGRLALEDKKPVVRLLIALVSLIMIFQIKAFVALVFLLSAIPFVYNKIRQNKRPLIFYFIVLFMAVSFASESDKFLSTGFYQLIVNKEQAFTEIAVRDNAGSFIETPVLEPNTLSFVKNTPIALFNALFRPLPGEIHGGLMWLMSGENFLLAAFILYVVFADKNRKIDYNLLLFSLITAFVLFLTIGLTTPVLGAVSRYRVIPLLFFEMALLQIIQPFNQSNHKDHQEN